MKGIISEEKLTPFVHGNFPLVYENTSFGVGYGLYFSMVYMHARSEVNRVRQDARNVVPFNYSFARGEHLSALK